MSIGRWSLGVVVLVPFAIACSSSSSDKDLPTGDLPDAVSDVPAEVLPDVLPDTPVDAVPDVSPDALSDVPSDVPADTPTELPPAPTKLTFLTYNTGLALGYVDYAALREPAIGPALALEPADVVCLQEVWTQASADALLAATNSAYPYHYLEVTDGGGTGGGEAACTETDVGPLGTCVQANCADIPPSELATCALGQCGTEFQALPDACSTCIAANIGKTIEEILTTCTTGSGGEYAYEGRNGLLLLSRHPLTGTEFLRFDSYLNVRVLLHAVIQPTGLDPVDVFCTHLTADLDPDVPYAGDAESWGKEQGAQVAALIAWVGQKAPATGRTAAVVMGDMNNGPAVPPDIEAVHSENYQLFKDATWLDPFAEATPPQCSWCTENTLVRDGVNEIIDHVLVVRAPAGTVYTATRALDEPVTLTGEGGPITTRLSDHYGVSVDIDWP